LLDFFFYSLRYFSTDQSQFSFSLAVQDERGPRKSKLPKITEINNVVPKNWTTRSKMYNKLMIPFVTQLYETSSKHLYLHRNVTDLLPLFLSTMDYQHNYPFTHSDYIDILVIHPHVKNLLKKSYVHVWVPTISFVLFRGLDEYVYEIGAQIFLTSLRQCRFNESMAILPNTVQNEILNRTWHQSFVLMAAFWPMNLITLLSGWAPYNIHTIKV